MLSFGRFGLTAVQIIVIIILILNSEFKCLCIAQRRTADSLRDLQAPDFLNLLVYNRSNIAEIENGIKIAPDILSVHLHFIGNIGPIIVLSLIPACYFKMYFPV